MDAGDFSAFMHHVEKAKPPCPCPIALAAAAERLVRDEGRRLTDRQGPWTGRPTSPPGSRSVARRSNSFATSGAASRTVEWWRIRREERRAAARRRSIRFSPRRRRAGRWTAPSRRRRASPTVHGRIGDAYIVHRVAVYRLDYDEKVMDDTMVLDAVFRNRTSFDFSIATPTRSATCRASTRATPDSARTGTT